MSGRVRRHHAARSLARGGSPRGIEIARRFQAMSTAYPPGSRGQAGNCPRSGVGPRARWAEGTWPCARGRHHDARRRGGTPPAPRRRIGGAGGLCDRRHPGPWSRPSPASSSGGSLSGHFIIFFFVFFFLYFFIYYFLIVFFFFFFFFFFDFLVSAGARPGRTTRCATGNRGDTPSMIPDLLALNATIEAAARGARLMAAALPFGGGARSKSLAAPGTSEATAEIDRRRLRT